MPFVLRISILQKGLSGKKWNPHHIRVGIIIVFGARINSLSAQPNTGKGRVDLTATCAMHPSSAAASAVIWVSVRCETTLCWKPDTSLEG